MARARQADHDWHHLPATEVMRLLSVDPAIGLSADEVRRRQAKFGRNRLTARRGKPAWRRLLEQFHQPLVYLLIAAAGVTAFLGEWVDCSVILGVVIVNAVVGFIQETKASKAIEALAALVPSHITVRRAERQQRVAAEDLVPGDVVLLEAGDRVPADVRLFRLRGLQVDESALTGESVPTHKQLDPLARETVLGDRKNLAYAGTSVTSGQGEGVVWATGDQTETGHIAHLISEATELSTPLTRKIAHFSRLLLWVVLALAVVTFLIGLARGEPASEMFMAAVALAVGAIPEGLPAAVTIVLAIGVSRMARRQAIIRHLPAVETLGSTTVICSDKTGTLTENQMTVREIYAGGQLFTVTGNGYEPQGEIRREDRPATMSAHPALAECLRAGALCNDAQVGRQEGRATIQGDPTEAALLIAAVKGGWQLAEVRRESPRVDAIPFASETMFRATLHGSRAGRMIYKVGALERLLERCSDALDAQGKRGALDKDAVRRTGEAMAVRGLRVLALARRPVADEQNTLDPQHVAAGLTFLGLQAMIDPPRPEAIAAVRSCQGASIAVKMITGDHLVTARAIAEQIGLKGRREHGQLLARAGRDLEKIPDRELPEVAEAVSVFARVAPEQKLRLVRALQARGHVVAMTGDGVNDAPALKQADIGIAMGVSGTDVAKGAAAMVLADDNFASIEAAVEEGRSVFDNLTKFIVWTLPTNLAEALILLTAIVLGLTLPALPVQLLWINLTTAIFLGLMLVFEPKEAGLMTRPPRDPRQPLLTTALIMRTGLVSVVMLLGAFWVFQREMAANGSNVAEARTAVINVIVMAETVYLFNCRSLHHSLLAIGLFSNRWVIGGALAMIAVQGGFTYTPVMNRLFHSAPLPLESWGRILLVAAITGAIVELEKWLRYGRKPSQSAVPE